MLGFGLWFKWQPEALQNISKPNNEQSFENKFIYILYLEDYTHEYQLKVWSDFFNFQEEIWFRDQFDGVWILFDSFFDFNKTISIFYLYNSLTQELTQYKIDGIPIIKDQIQYQIGKACDQCVIQNFVNCFTRFEGRISILFEKDNFDESSYLSTIENMYSQVNDCVEQYQKLIIGSQIYDINFKFTKNLGILEKFYFKLSGWVKAFDNFDNFNNYQMNYLYLLKIYKNYLESQQNYNFVITILYQSFMFSNQHGITVQYLCDSQKDIGLQAKVIFFPISMMTQWHFFQLSVGQTNQSASFKIYSNQLNEIISSDFQFSQTTGINYEIQINNEVISYQTKYDSSIANFDFQTFCQPLDEELIIKCHQICQTCFGPFYDNCLSCKSGSRRFLNNGQCLCDTGTFQFQEFETCLTIDDMFKNLRIIEEDLLCKIEGYDRCDENIICSFGYFKYEKFHCIQCPYYSNRNSDQKIQCTNCFFDPDQFSITLTCTYDAFQLNQKGQNVYDMVLRSEDDKESFEIRQLKNKFQLELLENKISKNPPRCRKGYFYENEKCFQCYFGCIECKSSIMCSKCEEGYYLDKNNICAKCQNCLKCELKNKQLNCLSCPQKYYLKNYKCFECGQYCADCRSNGFCNYCIDSQKYFISLDGINCLICNIQNCKYCYQVYENNDQKFYTSLNTNLEYLINEKQILRELRIQCAVCYDRYILDVNKNICVKQFDQDSVCKFGLYYESNSEFLCLDVTISSENCKMQINNCYRCVLDQCLECLKGFYVDFLALRCLRCPIKCENCILQNKRLMDNWKIEILVRYDKIQPNKKLEILSQIRDDYEIQCTSCPPNYILYNSNCIEGCNDECLKCEVIGGKAKCVEYANKIANYVQRGQWKILNKLTNFSFKTKRIKYTRSCYKPSPSMNGKKNFINQLSVIDCEKYNICKRKGIFTWNIYCDIQQYQEIQNKEGNYYFNDFFQKDIFSEVEMLNLLMNEYVIEQIDFILNFFQGNNNSCKPQEQTEMLIKIHSTFIYNIFVLKEVNLKVSGQSQNVLLEELIFDISGFQVIQFENLIFKRNQINITDILTNSISFINCLFQNDSSVQTLIPYNLNLMNVTIQITNIVQDSIFLFHFINNDIIQKDIKITIDDLKIIHSKFKNTKLIIIITEIGPKASILINNLQIIDTEFDNSSFLASSTSNGYKNMFFGNFNVTLMRIENVNIKNSSLFYIPNALQLSIDTLTIKNLKLQSNSYFLLSNYLNCQNYYLSQIEIDKSYLFSNKVPLLYQTSFDNLIKINLNYITIENAMYNQEQSLIQVVKYNNYKVILNLNYIRINQVSSTSVWQFFLSQEISSIYISCSQCYLNQIKINRKYGIPEISIIDSELIIISNSFFTQNEKQAQDLINDCQNIGQNSFPQYIYIGKYEKIYFDNLTIVDAISFNYPFIILAGVEIMQRQIEESIEIINSMFENNKMITSKSNQPTSIIQIQTKQKCLINLTNLQFLQNHLNMEIQDLITQSSSTLLIDAQLGIISINSCLFQQNIVSNSTQSPLYIKAQNLVQNIRKQSKLYVFVIKNKNIIQWRKWLFIGQSIICTKLFSSRILFSICAFYINTFGDSQILIENSNFLQTSSSLLSSASSNGGCFYIDAPVSKLTLLVKNNTFNQSFSRSQGGCFYIVPSNSFNFIYFESIKVINSFSTTSQFFEFSLSNLNDIISNVTFSNINIVSDQIAFNKFLGLLDNLSSDEASVVLNNDPILKIKYGNVTLNKIYCQLETKLFLASIEEGQIIGINQIHFKNGQIRASPFLSINLKSSLKGVIKMQNLKIDNLQSYQEMSDTQICQENLSLNTLKQFCITPIVKSKNIVLENNIEMIQQITLCQNQNLLFKSEKLKFSLISISNINSNHKIIFQEIFLNEIVCKYCQYGLIGFTNIDEYQQNNIILNGIIIQKSQCGITGCLTIINKNSKNYLKSNYLKKENRLLQEQIYEKLKLTLNFQVQLSNSKFIQNMANYGGAVCVIDINILIHQCKFFQNKAMVGGAIYSFSSILKNFNTIIFSSFLVDNQAELAADIYLENQILEQIQKLNLIIQNNSTNEESCILESSRSLALLINKCSNALQKETVVSSSTKVIEQAIIKPYTIIGFKEKIETLMFPSGQTIQDYYYFDSSTSTNIPYNLQFRIIALNILNQIEDQLDGSICTLEHKVINLTNQLQIEYIYAKLSINYITFNTSTLDFNLDNLIFYFNPYYEKELVLRLYIKCDMIQIPIYDENSPYLIKNIITDYTLFVDIKTFPCQLGEYFNSTSKICIKCNSDQSQYQVEFNATICSIKDETKIKSVEAEKIELKPNFWRAYFYSTKIEVCYHLLQNCLGGWHPGDISCSFGHIGALCEQCDLYNIRGNGHFSTSTPYKCNNCDQIEANIISILLVSLWTLISVLMSVNSTIDTIKLYISRSRLVLLGVNILSKQSSTAVLIKVFTNYLQIIQTISTFQLKVPAGFNQIFTSVGNPMEQVAYSLDCFLMSISDIQIIYFRIIWSLLMVISYVLLFVLLLIIAILLKQIKFNISMITTAIIYIFIYLQPNIIQQLISLVSFRILSEIAWIQGNVAYQYDTTSHKQWMIMFCLPILITFSLLIPQFMFYCIRSNKHHLEQIKTRETWGYLYIEYKLKAYYWEFIKIFQKELIIIFLAYYEDFIAIKASLVFLVIFAYSFISNSVQPYMTGELNRFDTQSTTVCAVSIILGSSIYTAQNQNFIEIVYPFYIIITLINGWFLLKMIINILLAYFDKLHEQIDKVKEIISKKFPNYISKHPQVKKLLESKRVKLKRIQSRYAIIKQHLMPQAKKILKIKNEQEIEKKSISSVFKFDQEIKTSDTALDKYNKFQNFHIKQKIFTDQESQSRLKDY